MNKTILILILAFVGIALCNPFNIDKLVDKQKETFNVIHDFHTKTLPQAFVHLQDTFKLLAKVHQANKRLTINPAKRMATTCDEAIANVNAIGNDQSCKTRRDEILSQSTVTDKVTTYCSSNCTSTTETALSDLYRLCSDRSKWPRVANQIFQNKRFFCERFENKDCFTVLASAVDTFNRDTDITGYDTERLNVLCSPCILRLLKRLALSGAINDVAFYKAANSLRAICTRIKGKYCVLSLKNALDDFNVFNSTETDPNKIDLNRIKDAMKKLLEKMCSPCLRTLIYRMALIDRSFVEEVTTFTKFCRRDGKDFCIVKLFDIAFSLIGSNAGDECNNLSNSTTCPGACKSFIQDFVKKGGCCWYLIVDIEKSGSTSCTTTIVNNQVSTSCTTTVVTESETEKFLSKCDVTPPKRCGTARLKFRIAFTNILRTWYEANKDTVTASVLNGVSYAAGGGIVVTNSASFVQSTSRNEEELVYEVELDSSNSITTSSDVDISDAFSDSTDIFPVEARSNPDAEVTVSGNVSNSSSIISVSFSILLFFILISLIF